MKEQSSDESEKSDRDMSPPKCKRICKGCVTDDQEMSSREDVEAEDQVDQQSERNHNEEAERSGGEREGQGNGDISSEDEMEDTTSQSCRPPTSSKYLLSFHMHGLSKLCLAQGHIRLDEGKANLAKSIGESHFALHLLIP